ncbi:peptidase M28 [Elysia marginata]|uniref:Carboxypeptidase Q n=1 Tax=Elysia marginata TaxID=1093978 RepID=A0AAV4G792_9GAST|nr:peptidase M28 [Elysia marginata]
MATTSDIRGGLCIHYNNDIYKVVEFLHVKPGKGPAFVRTKLKSVTTGKVIDNTFSAGHKIDDVRVETHSFQFLYADGDTYHFMNQNDYNQIELQKSALDNPHLLKEGQLVTVLINSETSEPLSVDMPAHVILEVASTEPGVKAHSQHIEEADVLFAREIFDYSFSKSSIYKRLEHISSRIGSRLSGSLGAGLALEYAKSQLDSLDLDRVWLQPVQVRKWVRGLRAYAYVKTEKGETTALPVCALIGSIATPSLGINAEVVEVRNFKDLKEEWWSNVQGKIVFYNHPMNPNQVDTFKAYLELEDIYRLGVQKAADYGAVGVIIRSATLKIDDIPHTGFISYGKLPENKYIPVVAISTKGANFLSSLLVLNPKLKFYFRQNCKNLGYVNTHNVIGEITGSAYPNKVIVVSGHLDSSDLGGGAHDNATGSVQSLGVLEIFKKLNYRPRHTIRLVLYMGEQNGMSGAKAYERFENRDSHIFVLENSSGGFAPRGFTFECTQVQFEKLALFRHLFEPYLSDKFIKANLNGGISFLRGKKTILAGLRTDSQRYFDLYHSERDIFKNVNKREFELGQGAMALLVYLVDKYQN